MQLNITIVDVEKKYAVGKTGNSYALLEVTYKDHTGKAGSKKILQFAYPEVFEVLSSAVKGDTFAITNEKIGEHWNWTGVGKPAAVSAPEASGGKPEGRPAPKSNYETPEERAHRQRLIVRQSALSNSIAILTPGAKAPLSPKEVMALAQELMTWVFEDEPKTLDNLQDDIPY